MTNGEILKKIREQNKDILDSQKALKTKREIFDALKKSLNRDNITILTGLRRVGKTTLMKQLISDLAQNQKNPKENILFFSFDEVITRQVDFLDRLIAVFLEEQEKEKKKYIFLDEIQYVGFWQGVIKKYYELNLKIKFVVSGSSSVFIKEKMADSLTGRVAEYHIEALNFREYLKIIRAKDYNFTPDLKNFFLTPDIKQFNRLSRDYADIKQEKEILPYLLCGEFPEVIKYPSLQEKYSYINNSIYKKLIEYDLPEIFTVQNKPEFIQLYDVLIKETANLIEIINLSREIGISKDTLKGYLEILNQAFLWDKIFNFTKSVRKKSRNLQKHYIKSTNFYAAKYDLSGNIEGIASIMGKLIETKCFWILKSIFPYVFFYFKQGQEVDFYISSDPLLRQMIPIEVKWKEKIRDQDLKTLQYVMSKKGIKYGFILAKDFDYFKIDSQGSCIWVIPVGMML